MGWQYWLSRSFGIFCTIKQLLLTRVVYLYFFAWQSIDIDQLVLTLQCFVQVTQDTLCKLPYILAKALGKYCSMALIFSFSKHFPPQLTHLCVPRNESLKQLFHISLGS